MKKYMNFPIFYILPYPPSDNEKYACRTSKVPSAIYKYYVESEVRSLVLEHGFRIETITEPVRMTVRLFPKSYNRDSANCLKVLQDALEKNGIIENDSLIHQVEVIRCEKDDCDAVIVEFAPMNKTLSCTMRGDIKRLLRHYRENTFFTKNTANRINEGLEIMDRGQFSKSKRKAVNE